MGVRERECVRYIQSHTAIVHIFWVTLKRNSSNFQQNLARSLEEIERLLQMTVLRFLSCSSFAMVTTV